MSNNVSRGIEIQPHWSLDTALANIQGARRRCLSGLSSAAMIRDALGAIDYAEQALRRAREALESLLAEQEVES